MKCGSVQQTKSAVQEHGNERLWSVRGIKSSQFAWIGKQDP